MSISPYSIFSGIFSWILPLGFIILVVWGLYRASLGHDDSMEPKTTPKDFFMNLFAFGTLYVSAISLGTLLFAYIDRLFPDPLNNMYGYYQAGLEQVRWPMAALIVLFPVFLILSRIINNDLVSHPEKKDTRVYKWLVYLTLTIASATIIIDLITLIYNFLGGDLTTRFGLKVLVVLGIALAAFGYYFWHLKTDLGAVGGKRKALIWISSLGILASIVAGFFILGSPISQRKLRFDEQRVQDLQNLQSEIINFWQSARYLPPELNYVNEYKDPVTKKLYEYKVINSLQFSVCADFEAVSADEVTTNQYRPMPLKGESWSNGIGRTCFDKLIIPQMNPAPVPVVR